MIGIDIVVISRIEKMIEKFGEKALRRFLNDDEMRLIKSPSTASGFWAAKEAASKAIGTGIGKECSFYDIKITKTKENAPKIKYKKRLRKKFRIQNSSLSITHDGGFAIAVVAIELKKKK
ncbi:MAG: holo-ACP synthase [Epsilonproteobacteria bacterium]|nr:MAG: holo-ACP synthase [Campylobacterota bacterium]